MGHPPARLPHNERRVVRATPLLRSLGQLTLRACLFHLMQNLNQSLTQYEMQFGPIPLEAPPGPDAEPG